MELDFTVVSEELGKTHVEELKPSGATTVVTNENRIEYIHLVADYKLNRQIRSQTNAFRQGLADVINLGEPFLLCLEIQIDLKILRYAHGDENQ